MLYSIELDVEYRVEQTHREDEHTTWRYQSIPHSMSVLVSLTRR